MIIYKISFHQIILIITLIIPAQLFIISHFLFWETDYKLNLFIGYFLNKIFTPLLSVIITVYLMINIDNFNWNSLNTKTNNKNNKNNENNFLFIY
jgi:uncharacterized membrane protein